MKKVLWLVGIVVALVVVGGCITVEYLNKPKPPTCAQAIGDFFKSANPREVPEMTVTLQNTAIVYSLNDIETQDRRLFCLVTPAAQSVFGCEKQGDAVNKCIMIDGVIFYYVTVTYTAISDKINKT